MASDLDTRQLDMDWADDKREESMKRLYDFTCDTTKDAIDWYWRKKRVGRLGRGLRLFAILFTALGGLVPLVRSAGIGTGADEGSFTLLPEYGYILVAIAAGLIAVDKFFGYSSTWIRFVTTATTLQTGFTKFQLEWALLRARMGGRELTPDDCDTLIQRLLALLTFVRTEVERETNAWTTEYLSNLANLEKEAKKQIESQAAGGIDITVENGDRAGILTATLDSAPIQSFSGKRCGIKPVFPGQHVVQVTGEIGGKPASASSGLIQVPPGQLVAVALTLK